MLINLFSRSTGFGWEYDNTRPYADAIGSFRF